MFMLWFALVAKAAGPLPDRMLNVVPWGEGEERARTVNTVYLTDGWTPERLRERLEPYGIDTLRVIFQSQMLDAGLESRWFEDIRSLSRAGFKLVIVNMTSRKDFGPSFQPYNSRLEGHLPIAERTRDAAPTWNRWLDDWQLVAGAFRDDANVIGYEIFNEFAPANADIPPGALYLRDLGGWFDAMSELTIDAGKCVWIQGLWAGTSFAPLEGKRDDRGRSLTDLFALRPGRIFPAIHVYNWYGKGFRRPESIEQVRTFLESNEPPPAIRLRLQAIVDEPDETRAMAMLHQFNFDTRWESTARLIDEARRVCGVGNEAQVWMSETGVGVQSFTGDARPDSTVATQYRAIVRACNAKNVAIAFWVDRGTRDGWGFFQREFDAPEDARRNEYRAAFLDRGAARLDFVSDPAELSQDK